MIEGSITGWISELRRGNKEAATQLWRSYFARMVDVARKRIQFEKTAFDEEDAALSAFDVFCSSIKQGKYPNIKDRDELWRLLCQFTIRKVSDRTKYETATKRGDGRHGERQLKISIDNLDPSNLCALEEQPDLVLMMADECQHLVSLLDDSQLESVALWKLEGLSNEEIAERLNYSRRTVQRMLKLIRKTWEEELNDDS